MFPRLSFAVGGAQRFGAAALVVAFALLGCAGSPPTPRARHIEMELGAEQRLPEVARSILERVRNIDCVLAWGDTTQVPPEAWHVHLAWGSGERLDGRVVCQDDADLVLHDPRASEMAMLYFHDHALHLGHPSQGGTMRLDRTPLGRNRGAPAPTLGVLDADSSDPDAPAFEVMRTLVEAGDAFLLIVWPIGSH